MESLVVVISLIILGLLALILIPSRHANAYAKILRNSVTALVGLECLLATALALATATKSAVPWEVSLFELEDSILSLSIYFDGVTGLMLTLVCFIGAVVGRFSIRYLDGEAMQGRYFRWLGFTIGAVSLMSVAGNLLLFFVAWVATSLGLHQLLLHYRHREAAHRAAWTKFAISRLGDAFLVGALILTFNTFGTFEFSKLFPQVRELSATSHITGSHAAIAWLLVLGAITKSAQFPFHSWLPETMETPTPVSALMHAGIVNAGGYLIIRMSPLVALAPSALMTLAVIGAFTACFAGVVMMTQPSVKRALAYSTIAQMGFMMLQCGLGAFSAAMLHILAHSLYKAHAFLNSGSVVSQMMAATGAKSPRPSLRRNLAYVFGAAIVSGIAIAAATIAFDVDVFAKPGGLVLAFILCLALTTWGWRLFSTGEPRTMLAGLAAVTGLCLAYMASYVAVAHTVQAATPFIGLPPTLQFVVVAIALAFFGLFLLHVSVNQRIRPKWLEPLQVHAANGFYVESIYRRVFVPLVRS